jgi:hypothetical protein
LCCFRAAGSLASGFRSAAISHRYCDRRFSASPQWLHAAPTYQTLALPGKAKFEAFASGAAYYQKQSNKKKWLQSLPDAHSLEGKPSNPLAARAKSDLS